MTPTERAALDRDGYIRLGACIAPEAIAALHFRLDAIACGEVATADHEPQFTNGKVRKLRGLEADPIFQSIFFDERIVAIGRDVVGPNISIMRASLISKHEHGGAALGWHQDVAKSWPMTAPPLLTFWFALDDATPETGCMQVMPGSHHHGRIGDGHYLPPEIESDFIDERRVDTLSVRAGEAIAFYCSLLHRSGVNRSGTPRRAVNLVLMDASIRHTMTGEQYPLFVSGNMPTRPHSPTTMRAIA